MKCVGIICSLKESENIRCINDMEKYKNFRGTKFFTIFTANLLINLVFENNGCQRSKSSLTNRRN